MSILIAYSWAAAIAIPDPKAISWVGPGNRYEVRTGADIPPEIPSSLPSPGGMVSADSLIASAGARFALSAFEIVASDGAMAKKMKVVLKAKSAMNGNFSGSVAVQSAAGGVGVERFVRL